MPCFPSLVVLPAPNSAHPACLASNRHRSEALLLLPTSGLLRGRRLTEDRASLFLCVGVFTLSMHTVTLSLVIDMTQSFFMRFPMILEYMLSIVTLKNNGSCAAWSLKD
uniref:Uncharacterized protein n=2 Tax=Picea TaxID=3328 RepID=A0A117NJ88_PICGL|nr:hypothetical protein ABT39_MTgene971 [Picea glauca]QHR92883.1 hypothetical protein Q903MT_gene6931 [Picea sitchensis]